MEKNAKKTNIPIKNMVSAMLKTAPTAEKRSRVRVILSKEDCDDDMDIILNRRKFHQDTVGRYKVARYIFPSRLYRHPPNPMQ